MRKFIYITAITVLFFIPSVCHSSFLIELKNGHEYITDQYWQTGSNLQFNYYGGTVSIPESSVVSIVKSDRPHYEIAPVAAEGSESRRPSGRAQGDASGDEGKTGQERPFGETGEEVDIQSYRERNIELKNGLGSALRELRESSRDRNKLGKKYARERIIKYSSQLYSLTDKLKRKNGGVLPEDWWEGAAEL